MNSDEKTGIERLVRSNLAGFTGYSASISPDTLKDRVDVSPESIIKLNANENPYGCSPRVQRALADISNISIYPDNGQQELRSLLAKYAGVPVERVVAGHGSNTLIDMLVRLFVGPGDAVINCVPTFDIYRFSTEICGGTLVNITRDKDYNIDIAGIISAVGENTKLIFIANPNNPTGNVVPRDEVMKILETGVPLLLDEAYYEFYGETLMPLTEKYDNLMILRSFSKWAGLAGLRVGYGVFPPRIADYLMAIKIPHSISVVAEMAVRESLADLDYLRERVRDIVAERERLYRELQSIDWLKAFPSKANFIFCNVLEGGARDLFLKLEKKGILVRYFDIPLLENSIRITVGKPEHTDALLRALRVVGP
ncbi:MAG: histidinol-phosphate transaminase [Dehalococcoidia bacterium]